MTPTHVLLIVNASTVLNLSEKCLEMFDFSLWRNPLDFPSWERDFFVNRSVTSVQYKLASTAEHCQNHGSLLNVFDPMAGIILKHVRVLVQKRFTEFEILKGAKNKVAVIF